MYMSYFLTDQEVDTCKPKSEGSSSDCLTLDDGKNSCP
jgi:hypothetical protein